MASAPDSPQSPEESALSVVHVCFGSRPNEKTDFFGLSSREPLTSENITRAAYPAERVLARLLLDYIAADRKKKSIKDATLFGAARGANAWVNELLRTSSPEGVKAILLWSAVGGEGVSLTGAWNNVAIVLRLDGLEESDPTKYKQAADYLGSENSPDPWRDLHREAVQWSSLDHLGASPGRDRRPDVQTDANSPDPTPNTPERPGSFEEAFGSILRRLQELATSGWLASVVSEMFPDAPRRASGEIDVAKLVVEKRANDVLLSAYLWLKGRRPSNPDRDALKEFCAGVALTAVSPAWVLRLREDRENLGWKIPRKEDVLASEDANLAIWIIRAVTWKDGFSFGFDGLIGQGKECRQEIRYDQQVVERGPTDEESLQGMRGTAIRVVIPGEPDATFRDPERLKIRFGVTRDRMEASREKGEPYWISYDDVADPAGFLARLAQLGLDGHRIAYLLCRSPLLPEVIPGASKVVLRLHDIRELLK